MSTRSLEEPRPRSSSGEFLGQTQFLHRPVKIVRADSGYSGLQGSSIPGGLQQSWRRFANPSPLRRHRIEQPSSWVRGVPEIPTVPGPALHRVCIVITVLPPPFARRFRAREPLESDPDSALTMVDSPTRECGGTASTYDRAIARTEAEQCHDLSQPVTDPRAPRSPTRLSRFAPQRPLLIGWTSFVLAGLGKSFGARNSV